MMRSVVFFTLALLLSPAVALAQPQESRTTVTALTGVGKTFDDEGSLGNGWIVGGSLERVVFGTTRAEVSLEHFSHHRDSEYFGSSGGTTVVGATLVHRFGRRQAQPYLFAGLTVGRHSGTNRFSSGTTDISSTNHGLRFGFGIAVRVGERFEVSPELRMNGFYIDRDSDPATIPSLGIRFGMRL